MDKITTEDCIKTLNNAGLLGDWKRINKKKVWMREFEDKGNPGKIAWVFSTDEEILGAKELPFKPKPLSSSKVKVTGLSDSSDARTRKELIEEAKENEDNFNRYKSLKLKAGTKIIEIAGPDVENVIEILEDTKAYSRDFDEDTKTLTTHDGDIYIDMGNDRFFVLGAEPFEITDEDEDEDEFQETEPKEYTIESMTGEILHVKTGGKKKEEKETSEEDSDSEKIFNALRAKYGKDVRFVSHQ